MVQEQYSDAVQQLEQLLHRQPGNYTALARLLTLLRRVGRVEEGEAHLHTAQDHVSRTAGTAGRPGHTTVLMRTEKTSLVHGSHLRSNNTKTQRICGAAGSVSAGFTCCPTPNMQHKGNDRKVCCVEQYTHLIDLMGTT